MATGERAEKRAGGKRARLRRLALRSGAAFLILAALALVLLHTSLAKEALRERVEATLNRRFVGAVSIASLDYGFLFSDLQLRGVEIRDRDDRPAIAIASVDLQLNRWASLRDGPDIARLDVDQVRIDLRIDEEGHSNLRGLVRPPKGPARALRVHAFDVDALHVQITAASGATLAIRNGRIRGSLRQGSATELIASEIAADLHLQSARLLAVKGTMSSDGLRLHKTEEGVELRLQPVRAELQVGRGDVWQETEFSLAAGHVSMHSGTLLASLRDAVIGPVRVGEARAELALADGLLQGPQQAILSELRVDATSLGLLLGRDLRIGEASGQLAIAGPADAMAITGTFQAPEGHIEMTGTIDAAGPDAVSYAIETTTNLRLDELGLLPRQALVLEAEVPTRFHLAMQGSGLPFQGGELALQLQAFANAGGKESMPLELRAHAENRSVQLDSLKLKLFGAELEGDGHVNTGGDDFGVGAHLTLHGNANEVVARLEELGLRLPPGLRLPSQLSIKLAVRGNLDDRLILTLAPSTTRVAGGKIMVVGQAVFAAKDEGLEFVSARGRMALEDLELRGLARLVRRRAPLDGTLRGNIDLEQSGERRNIVHSLRLRVPAHGVELRADGAVRDRDWQGKVVAYGSKEGAPLAWLEGTVPLVEGLRLRARGPLDVRVEIPTTTLRAHVQRLPAALRARLAGLVEDAEGELRLDLRGTPKRPAGTLSLGMRTRARALPDVPIDLALTADLRSDASGVMHVQPTGAIRAGQGRRAPRILLSGKVSLSPKSSLPLAERVHLDLNGELPELALSSLAIFSANRPEVLSELPGDVQARFALRDTLADPRLELLASLAGMANLAGSTAQLQGELVANRRAANLELRYGAGNPLRIHLDATRAGQEVRVQGQFAAQSVPLAELLPATLPSLLDQDARVHSDLSADATLALREGKAFPVSLSLQGATRVVLDRFALPATSRSFRDIELAVQGKGEALTAALQIEERDGEKDARRLTITGDMAWPGPGMATTADARIRAHRWLLFGGTLGPADAPRATLDADLGISAALGSPMPVVDLTVHALAYSEPERESFTHGLESIAPGGDIVFADSSTLPVGKLAAPGPQAPTNAGLASLPPALLRLHLPAPISVAKGPLRLAIRGDLELPIGHGTGPSGSIEVVDGSIDLFRELYLFEEGAVDLARLSDTRLFFSTSLPPDVARKLSRASAGEEVVVQLRPLGGGPVISFLGAGNEDMIEALSLTHTGQPYFRSEPDAVASSTVRSPRAKQPLTIAFVKANIPRLHIFDRFAAWSNAYDSNQSYGQLRYLDAEKRLGDGNTRLRLLARPEQIGRSISEVQVDRFFVESRSMRVGVGARAGSRLGGGVGVFFEWSSED